MRPEPAPTVPPALAVEVARDPAAVAAALDLRGRVFVDEMGAQAEADAHDAFATHLVLRDPARPDLGVVGTTRLGRGDGPGFYVEREFDLSAPRRAGLAMAEMGRTCVHGDYRTGWPALALMRTALEVARGWGVDLLVGTGSLPGADAARHAPALAALEARALAPEAIRPVARGPEAVFPPPGEGSMRGVPALLKSYLRAGARVGRGGWVDAAFGTVDVCLLLDPARARLPGR